MSNLGFENFIKKNLKFDLIRTNVGDINVISAMKRNKSFLGGEQSGHIILSEFSNTGDGILAALKIIEIMSKKNSKTSNIFNLYDELPQIKINIPYDKINDKVRKKINLLSKNKSLNKKNFRFLIRFSGTEPVIRILVEGPKSSEVKLLANKLEIKVRSLID